ncbi:alanine racemase [Noviherbaspirillum saxi]|uniref:Alanine racemase n=1 Tax=Noviherbaspirillum saxi TaxID=2320863 RepID=A0A3A3G6H6_9BURK|nr:alanine racemase [Noviherbaspirillum saxi]RJF97735.1 alanine racemase [Noviherbaspirillum saxi]
MAERAEHAGAILNIDLSAIQCNYRILQRLAGKARCAGVLKANAYGLGANEVATALSAVGCTHFFVAHLDEGLALRPHVPESTRIFVLHGPPVDTEMEFVRHRLTPVLNSLPQVVGWQRTAHTLNRRLPAILQVDTGMSRLGLSKSEVQTLLLEPDPLRGIDLQYLMSHLACAEQTGHPMNQAQLAAFTALRKGLPPCPASFANSSGIFLGPDYHFDLVRPGAALYGISPSIDSANNPMQPVVRLQGRIIQTRYLGTGDRVGYSLTYQASGPCCIATIAVGYADGWLRAFSNRGAVLIGGTRAPIVGNVSMDTVTVDATEADPALLHPGMLVDLIAPDQPVDVVAAQAGTIGYEILTGLGNRYRRQYVGVPMQVNATRTYQPACEPTN